MMSVASRTFEGNVDILQDIRTFILCQTALTVGVNALVCMLPGVNQRVLNSVFSVSSYILVLRSDVFVVEARG